MTRIIEFLKRRGMTLVEALVMILVAGNLMIPIAGTLTQGVRHTTKLEVQTIMQNLAESEMNDLVYRGLYEGSVPSNKSYEVKWPDDTDYQYRFIVSVEASGSVSLKSEHTSDIGGLQHSDLCLVGVVVDLLESEIDQDYIAVTPVSLISMLCLPPTPPDMVYAAEPDNNRIVVINPMNYEITDYIDMKPEIPLHMAVHPNGKLLAVRCSNEIHKGKAYLVDIDPTSPSYKKNRLIDKGWGEDKIKPENNAGYNGARLQRGIVFSADGRFLYLYADELVKVYKIPTPSTITFEDETPVADGLYTSVAINNMTCTDMKLLDDGTVAVARASSSDVSANDLLRLNTHTNAIEKVFLAGAGSSYLQFAVAGTWGNSYIYARTAGAIIAGTNLAHPTDFVSASLNSVVGSMTKDSYHHSLLVSPDNQWLVMSSSELGGAASERLLAFKLPLGDGGIPTPNDKKLTRGAAGADSWQFTQLTQSPNRNEFIAKTNNGNKLFFANYDALVSGSYANCNSLISSSVIMDAPVSDVAARVAEYAYIICSDGTNHRVETLDIFGGRDGTGIIVPERMIKLASDATSIALDAGGSCAVLTYSNTGAKPQQLDCAAMAVSDFNGGSLNFPSDNPPPVASSAVFLSDGSMLVLTSRTDSSNGLGLVYPDMDSSYHKMDNGFVLYSMNQETGKLNNSPELGFVAQGADGADNAFRVKDVAVMSRRPGAYVLMAHATLNDSILLWVEKSKDAGYSGEPGEDKFKILGYWRGIHDDFPVGKPAKIALSHDDTLLAIYDTHGDGTNQVVRIYDLVNNRFPTKKGLVFNRFDSNTGDFAAPPSDVPLDIKNAMTTYKSDTPQDDNNPDFPLVKKYPFNFHSGDLTSSLLATSTTRSFGYWYNPVEVQSIGYRSKGGGIRIAIDGAYAATSQGCGIDLTTSWLDETVLQTAPAAARGRFNRVLPRASRIFQGDFYSKMDTPKAAAVGYRTQALSSETDLPGDFNKVQDSLPGPVKMAGSGSDFWNLMPEDQFRAFRFRPSMIHEILLDDTAGSPVKPNLELADGDKLLMAFNRDTSRPVLTMLDQKSGRLFFHCLGWGKPSGRDFGHKLPADHSYNDMAYSPDGRRLIITSTSPNKVLTLDVAYPLGNSFFDNWEKKIKEQINDPLFKPKTLEYPPLKIAVRPFSSFSSITDSYSEDNNTHPSLAGNQRAVVADGGIYIAGGTKGNEGAPSADLQKFNPFANNIESFRRLNRPLGHHAVVNYDNRIMALGGDSGSEIINEVVSLAPTLDNLPEYHAPLQEDDNTPYAVKGHAAVQTPYGTVISGGAKKVATPGYYKHSISDFSTQVDFTSSDSLKWLKMSKNVDAGLSVATLQLSYDGKKGSSFIEKPFPIYPNTSFKAYFHAKMKGKDGLAFVFHNGAAGAAAIGASNKSLGLYDGNVGPYFAIILDNKKNGNDPSDDFVALKLGTDKQGHVPTAYSNLPVGTLGGQSGVADREHHWWVEYDGPTNTLGVYYNLTANDRNTAVKAFSTTANLYNTLNKSGVSQAWVGFTGANNHSGGYMQISAWDLELFNDVDGQVVSFPNEDFDKVEDCFQLNGKAEESVGSDYLALCDDEGLGKPGTAWLANPIRFTPDTDFVAYFKFKQEKKRGGLTFTIQPHDNRRIGENKRGNMGLSGGGTPITSGVSIEFDTYKNILTGDPNKNHIALIVDGKPFGNHYGTKKISNEWLEKWRYVWIKYDSSTQHFSVYFKSTASVPDLNSSTDRVVYINLLSKTGKSLIDYLGSDNYLGDDSRRAWVGFTANNKALVPWPKYNDEIKVSEFSFKVSTPASTVDGSEVKVYYPHALDGREGVSGLRGEYFKLSPAPSSAVGDLGPSNYSSWQYKATRIDSELNFDWGWVEPGTGVGDDNFAIRWTGWLIPPESGTYDLQFWHDDGVRMWLDDTLVLGNKWYVTPSIKSSCSLNMKVGVPVKVKIEYYEAAGEAELKFEWRKPTGTSFNIVPSSCLRYKPLGDTISMKSLPSGTTGHVMVPFFDKGEGEWQLVSVGGGATSDTYYDEMICWSDFSSNAWNSLDISGVNHRINFADANSPSLLNRRNQAAVCVWGDEIFVFGGVYGHVAVSTAIAYNPTTKRMRELEPLPAILANATAVPFGPYIYIIGGTDSLSGSGNAKDTIYRYKP